MSKTLDLRHIPRSADGKISVGERTSIDTSRDAISIGTSQNVELAPKHPRERIWEFVALSGRAVSRGEIAKGLGYKKAPWINAHIESLVQDGWLERGHTIRPGGVVMFWYRAKQA
jgi:hypothetical protein